MKTTLIICCKNEAHTLPALITASRQFVDEIVIIDGHSTDGSRETAKKLKTNVVLDNGKGKGAAIQLGIKTATGDIIVFMDADGSHKPTDIPKLIKPIAVNNADLVIASRGKGGSDELHGTFEKTIRMIGSAIITQLINWRFSTHITDSQNGFRSIRTSVARQLRIRENSFAVEQEMLIKTLKAKYRVEEVPSHELERKYGTSTISLRRMWWRYIWNVFKNCL